MTETWIRNLITVKHEPAPRPWAGRGDLRRDGGLPRLDSCLVSRVRLSEATRRRSRSLPAWIYGE